MFSPDKSNLPPMMAYLGVYSEILVKVREEVKDLRISQINPIMAIGEVEGIRCAEIAKILRISQPNAWKRLNQLQHDGWAHKKEKGYYLTTEGWKVYRRFHELWSPHLNELMRWLASRVAAGNP